MTLLAPDARLVGDSGGKSKAPLRVIESADKVGRFLLGAAKSGGTGFTFRIVELNAGPAVLALVDGEPDSVFQVDIADGHVQCVYIVRNPDKLMSLA